MRDGKNSDGLVEEAVEYLNARLPFSPRVGIVLGSGLGAYAEKAPVKMAEPYADIPGFPRCAIQGHEGRLVLTDRCGPPVAILQGRVHRYEGWSLQEVTRPVNVLARLGVQTMVFTCAAGGLAGIAPGGLMLVRDHLNLLGENPLAGSGGGGGFLGFVEMSNAYDPALSSIAERAASDIKIPLPRGVLACLLGPTYETPAEAEMLRRLGADAVSMSTVPEVIVARAMGMRVLALALITNRAGVPMEEGDSHHRVIDVAGSKAQMIEDLLDRVLGGLGVCQ